MFYQLRRASSCNAPIHSSLTFNKMLTQAQVRVLSSTSAAASEATEKPKAEDSNIFLDNLGKIFLVVVASIVGTLVRGSYNTSNKNAVRDAMEEASVLDPCEIEDMRIANTELTPEVFRKIMDDLGQSFPQGTASYHDFIPCVRRTMKGLKGDAFTIQLGHLLDRVVIAILKEQNKSEYDELPIKLLLAALSLALNSPVPDRIRILYEILEREDQPVRFSKVRPMVGYLQETCQLVPDSEVVETETKYPTIQYRKGTPEELVPWEGSETDPIDLDAFAAILRSHSVCAWGECYHKKKF
jgi:hypothetical protein